MSELDAVARTKADLNRSRREDQLVAEIERLEALVSELQARLAVVRSWNEAPFEAVRYVRAVTDTRSAADYAIEFGRYLATAAEQFMAEQNRAAEAEEMPDSDHWRALEGVIHEFRKRAERAGGAVRTGEAPNPR